MKNFDSFIGQTFEGRYTIVNVIGIGGMATVYGAYDQVSGRSVAIKMMNKKMEHNARQIKLFVNESTALSLLSHPNIVQVYNTVITNSTKYIIMEYVEGITLKKHIDHRGALPEREVIYYASQILSALDYIHSRGIVHCDIKPQNIILLPNGSIKVADFGIARLDAMLDRSAEKSDTALGTVYYVSPEQAQGKTPQAQSDIYSLGVMLYEAMTNRLPFCHESTDEVARMQINKEPIPPSAYRPDISVGLEQIILRAMEKSTKNRYASAQEMLTDIRALRQNEKTVFGSDKKSSRYRIINRKFHADLPNVSNRNVFPLSEKGEGFANSQNAFGKNGSASGPFEPKRSQRPSALLRAAQSQNTMIAAQDLHRNTNPQKRHSGPLPQSERRNEAVRERKPIPSQEDKHINSPDILSVMLGVIASLVIVILLALGIWFIISPNNMMHENPTYSINETTYSITETEDQWNTEHTEKF